MDENNVMNENSVSELDDAIVVNEVPVPDSAPEANAPVSDSAPEANIPVFNNTPEVNNASVVNNGSVNEAPVFGNVVSPQPSGNGVKPMHVPSLVLGIVAVVFAFIIPLVSYVCGIIGIVLAVKNKKDYRSTAGLVLSIIGIVVALVVNIISAVVVINMLDLSMR